MTETTQKALAAQRQTIELMGNELAETMTYLLRAKAVVSAMDVIGIAGYRLAIHWPETATGELDLESHARPLINTNHERQPNVA